MSEAEFEAADLTGIATATIDSGNNPIPNQLKLGGGRVNKMLTAPDGRIFIYDGSDAIYLEPDRTEGATHYYVLTNITQVAAEFAALVAG